MPSPNPSDEHAPDSHDTSEQTDDDAPTTAPLVAFAQRHRFVIGIGVGVAMTGLMVFALIALTPSVPVPGLYGVVQQFAFPLMCGLIAVVAVTWGLRLHRQWTNLAAYAAIATYLIYLAVGWIYEQFIA